MDYSFCQALAHSRVVERALCIYDIACSWGQHFLERVHQSHSLNLRVGLEITAAVGKFHLGAHTQDCFPLFSLNFVKGAAQVDGEILETLWSPLIKVAGSTRGMSQAHRQELLDSHMNDSNWKKLVKSGRILIFPGKNIASHSVLVQSLLKKWTTALHEREETKLVLEELTDRISEEWVSEWKTLEECAMAERGEHLRIYDVELVKGLYLYCLNLEYFLIRASAPSLPQVHLELIRDEPDSANMLGISNLLVIGLGLESSQCVFTDQGCITLD